MTTLDWAIVAAYLLWVVGSGLRSSSRATGMEGYFLAGRSIPWWAAGLSVMATQISAITLVGTTGQGYATGLRFVQFYFGLPLAMLLLSVTVVPFFHRTRVFTAYEYLERRFDVRVRTATSVLFLLGRAFSLGVTLAAPAVVMSSILGWSIPATVICLSVPMVIYTSFGGVHAVAWADVKQMVLITGGLAAAIVVLVHGITREASLGTMWHLAGATGRMKAIDTRLDVRETYTLWSGLLGGLFLHLSYFGCDQSQVQRYLTARSERAGRQSLLVSAFVKIPFQIGILLTGILVFLYYSLHAPPMLFNHVHDRAITASARHAEYVALDARFSAQVQQRRDAVLHADRAAFLAADSAMAATRTEAVALVKAVSGDQKYSDVNYVFPTFITSQLPMGLAGILVAAIFAAAMSSASGELSGLSSATIIDVYQRHLVTGAADAHYLRVSKWVTAGWGLLACGVSIYAAGQGSLIEVVNRYGSFFYGSILGVFMLAILTKRATATGALIGLAAGMTVVLAVAFTTSVAFLWHNLIGAVVVVAVGLAVSAVTEQALVGQ